MIVSAGGGTDNFSPSSGSAQNYRRSPSRARGLTSAVKRAAAPHVAVGRPKGGDVIGSFPDPYR
ncbi:hypothetical protein GCM10009546_66480 [Actinomadura livida]|uniref:Uncharacterized protein n=1 Tax=Actinomadura livida TaxID=79909 RepID=A0ABN1FPA6_9ACTN|nr:hypothetical protein GCM10010208_09030 [Actinomadura livida]